MVLEKTLKSALDYKEIKPVNPKGNQFWIYIGRADVEAPILWPPDVKSLLIGEDPDAGKDRRQKEKQWKQCQTLFWGASKSLQMVIAAIKLKDAYSLEGKLWPT